MQFKDDYPCSEWCVMPWPPPDGNAGFEFSGHRFSPEESAGFSDFFEQVAGRAAGGPAGDLLLEVQFRSHPRFRPALVADLQEEIDELRVELRRGLR